MRDEFDIIPQDTVDVDLIVSLGSDRTYMRSSGLAPDWSLPVIGINTQLSSETSNLFSNTMSERKAYDNAVQMIKSLDDPEKRVFRSRSRILVDFQEEESGESQSEMKCD